MIAAVTTFKISATSASTTISRGDDSFFSWYDTLSTPEDPFFAAIAATVSKEVQVADIPVSDREAFEKLLSLAAKPKRSK